MNQNYTRLQIVSWTREALKSPEYDVNEIQSLLTDFGCVFVDDSPQSKLTKSTKSNLSKFKELVQHASNNQVSLSVALEQMTTQTPKGQGHTQQNIDPSRFDSLKQVTGEQTQQTQMNFAMQGMIKVLQNKRAEVTGSKLFMAAYQTFLNTGELPTDPGLQQLILQFQQLEQEQNSILLGNDSFSDWQMGMDANLNLTDLNFGQFQQNLLPSQKTTTPQLEAAPAQ